MAKRHAWLKFENLLNEVMKILQTRKFKPRPGLDGKRGRSQNKLRKKKSQHSKVSNYRITNFQESFEQLQVVRRVFFLM